MYFQTKNPNLGKFLMVLQWKMFVHFVAVWVTLWSFGIFYGHLVHVMVIWYMLWSFGTFFPFWYVAPGKIWQPWFPPVL
jgi:hypothetical protein